MRHALPAFCAFLVVLLTGLAYDADVNGGLDLFHEGERLAHYDTLAGGGLPYRDFYVPHGLGEDVLKPLLAFTLYGESVESLRRVGQNSYIARGWLPPLGVLSLLLAGWALLGSTAWFLLFCVCVTTGLLEVSERYAFGFLAVACLALHAVRGRRRWLVAAGVMAGLAFLYSAEIGVYVAVAAASWLLLESRARPRPPHPRPSLLSSMSSLTAGLAIVLVPFISWCLSKGIGRDLSSNLYVQFVLRRAIWPKPYPVPHWSPNAPIQDNVGAVLDVSSLYYLIPLACLLAVVIGAQRSSEGDRSWRGGLLLAGLVTGTFWMTVVGRPDRWHVAYVAGAVYLLLVTLAKTVGVVRRRVLRVFLGTGILVVAAPLFRYGEGGYVFRTLRREESRAVPGLLSRSARDLRPSTLFRLGRVTLPAGQAVELEAVTRYIRDRTQPDDSILDLSDRGLLYFLCQRRCPSRFHFLAHCNLPPLKRQMIAETLAGRTPPEYVIWTAGIALPDDVVGRFVAAGYVIDRTVGSFALYRRK